MRILQIPRRFVRHSWGGTETVILETSRRLLAQGHETEVLTTNALASVDHEIVGGVAVRRFPYFYPYIGLSEQARHRLDMKGGNAFSTALMRHLQSEAAADVFHLHTGKRLGGIVRHVARQRCLPYVVSLHGGVFDVPAREAATWTAPSQGSLEWGKALGWWVGSRRVLQDAAAILCVGAEEHRQVTQKFPHKRVIHLPNGVDVERFAHGDGPGFRHRHGIDARARIILVVGRIDPQKGQLHAVRLLGRLLGREPSSHLLAIGPVVDDGYHREIQSEIQSSALESRVTLIPGLDAAGQELVDAYHAADVFLLPSVHEPFGIVVLEAWAAGLPVVANRIGGVASLVDHGVDGLLVDPTNDDEILAALTSVLSSAARRWALAAAARKRVAGTFDWSRVTSTLASIYEEVAREHTLRQ